MIPSMAQRRGPKPSATDIRRAVIYRRISNDRTGEEAGVARQQEDCERYCTERGWPVVADLEDNDISASRYGRKKRHGYLAAISLIESGEANALVAWHLDRLWRQPKELEQLIDLAEKHDVLVVTLYGEVDLTTGDGRFMARILVSAAAKASDDASRRILRVKQDMLRKGLPVGGVRAFGWNDTDPEAGIRAGTVIVPDEADLIRAACRRFLQGASLNSIARAWNEAGAVTPQGGHGWTGTQVRVVLSNPRNAGLRSYKGEVIPGEVAWSPIVDARTWRQVVARLDDPARKSGPKRSSLLTGLVQCGVPGCGAGMVRNGSGRRPVFVCRRRVNGVGCNGVTASATAVEETVTKWVLARVESDGFRQALAARHMRPEASRDLVDAIEVDETKLREIEDDYANGLHSRAAYFRLRDQVAPRLDANRQQLARNERSVVATEILGLNGDLRSRWKGLEVDRQRAIIAAIMEKVVVSPTTRRGAKFDVDRLDPKWRF